MWCGHCSCILEISGKERGGGMTRNGQFPNFQFSSDDYEII